MMYEQLENNLNSPTAYVRYTRAPQTYPALLLVTGGVSKSDGVGHANDTDKMKVPTGFTSRFVPLCGSYCA
jgi:hypothetical protein